MIPDNRTLWPFEISDLKLFGDVLQKATADSSSANMLYIGSARVIVHTEEDRVGYFDYDGLNETWAFRIDRKVG